MPSREGDGGGDFEKRIEAFLLKSGFTPISKEKAIENISQIEQCEEKYIDKQLKNLKKQILSKEDCLQFLQNPFKKLKSYYIYQFNGTQNFPDFLLFIGNYVIPLEIKFSKKKEKKLNSLPKWNSNLPKYNAFYIYARQGKDLIFFNGSDFIHDKARIILQDFFKNIQDKNDELMKELQKELDNLKEKNKESNIFGLSPYIRKDFNYKKEYRSKNEKRNTNDIFDETRKKRWKDNVFEIINREIL